MNWIPVINKESRWFLASTLTSCFTASLLFGYLVLIKPSWAFYQSLKTKENSLREEFKQKQTIALGLAQYQQQLKQLNTQLARQVKSLYEPSDLSRSLDDITKIGQEIGLMVQSVSPEPKIKHDFYSELPLNLIVVGHYRQFGVFLSRLAESSKMITTHDVSIQPLVSMENKLADSKKLVMRLVVKLHLSESNHA